uniref:Acetylcholine receptor subunit alpha-like n=1 Tax=Crassostrea virginica TaxID=6565 RepID=A0A8B8CP59_CRAVI|nr:acetylcholine receptor subunit alpha-like [Crassostrea virginica]
MDQLKKVYGLMVLLTLVKHTEPSTTAATPLTCSICETMPYPNLEHVKLLFRELFTENNDYSNLVFPHEDQLATIKVNMKFALYSIPEFDELGGTLSVIGRLKMAWFDHFVIEKYVPQKHVLEVLNIPQDDIWLPPITVFNSVESLTPVGHSGYEVTVTLTNGYIQWEIGVVTKTGCTVVATDYPFDTQYCTISFTPWGYSSNEVAIQTDEDNINLEDFIENEEWAVMESSQEITVAANRSIISYHLTLKRRPVFFIVNMMVPIVLLGMLNSLCFVLPIDSGERVGFATNVFLTFAVYLTILSSELPVSNPLSIMSYYVAAMLSVSSITTLIAIFTIQVSIYDPNEKVPAILVYTVAFFTCRLCRKRYRKMGLHHQTFEKMPLDDAAAMDPVPSAQIEDEEEDEDSIEKYRFGVSWMVVGKTLDKFFFLLFSSGTIAVSGYYLDEVWKPPITVFNSVNALHAIGDSNYYVRIQVMNSGAEAEMEWFPGIVTRTACNVDVSNYPWDIQQCAVQFTPWGYRPAEIDFNLTTQKVDTSKFQGSDTWEIRSSFVIHETINNASFARYTLQLARKPSFFLMYIVLPIELLALLNVMVFILPADSGERVGYSVTVFLTLAVYVTIISDNLPKTSSPMSIFAYFMITMLMISAFICFVTIVTLRAYIREDETPVPRWVKRAVGLAYCRCCPRKKSEDEDEEETETKRPPTPRNRVIKVDTDNSTGRWAKLREQTLKRNTVFPQKSADIEVRSVSEDSSFSDSDEEEEEEEMEWSTVGTAIDVVCIFTFFTIIFLVSLSFLAPLAISRV